MKITKREQFLSHWDVEDGYVDVTYLAQKVIGHDVEMEVLIKVLDDGKDFYIEEDLVSTGLNEEDLEKVKNRVMEEFKKIE